MPQFGNRLTTTTREKYLPKFIDTILDGNVFTEMMLKKAKKWSGAAMNKTIKFAKNSNGGSFNGFSKFNTSAVDTRTKIRFEPKFYEIPVVLSLAELSVNENSPEEAFINLAKAELESSAQDATDDIGTMFYGDGTGNGGLDFQGLAAIVADSGNYGGLARSVYTGLKAAVRASGGTLTLAQCQALHNDTSSGDIKPDFWLSDESVFSLMETLVSPKETYMLTLNDIKNGITGGTGARELYYKGAPIKVDEKCTSGTLFALNSKFLDWYGMPMAMYEALPYGGSQVEESAAADPSGVGFSWSKWLMPTDQPAVISHICLGGNLISYNPRRLGKITGITNI